MFIIDLRKYQSFLAGPEDIDLYLTFDINNIYFINFNLLLNC